MGPVNRGDISQTNAFLKCFEDELLVEIYDA